MELAIVVLAVWAMLGPILGWRKGFNDGLHQPLSTRQRVLKAELRRAENNLGAAMPIVRRATYRRPGRREKSE